MQKAAILAAFLMPKIYITRAQALTPFPIMQQTTCLNQNTTQIQTAYLLARHLEHQATTREVL
jgi:hypothetical protein